MYKIFWPILAVALLAALSTLTANAKPEIGEKIAASERVSALALSTEPEWIDFEFKNPPAVDNEYLTFVFYRTGDSGYWFARDWFIVDDWGVVWQMYDVDGNFMGENMWHDHSRALASLPSPLDELVPWDYSPGRVGRISLLLHSDERFPVDDEAWLEIHVVAQATPSPTSVPTFTITPIPTPTVVVLTPTPTSTPAIILFTPTPASSFVCEAIRSACRRIEERVCE